MDGNPVIEEEYVDKHYRIVKVDDGKTRFYSIDYYRLLPAKPQNCKNTLVLDDIEICYINISEHCEAVILASKGRVELINLRLKASIDEDPARGSMVEARNICLKHIGKVAEVA